METTEHRYKLTENPNNKKVGRNVFVTTTSRSSCSDACLLKAEYDEDGKIIYKGCYADQFHMKMHWDKVTSGERGYSLTDRRNLAWTYTSYPLTGFNLETIREMLRLNFVVNKSCFSLEQVDIAMDLGIPATVVLPSKTEGRKLRTPKGRIVARCPAEVSKDINCGNCGGNKGPLCLRKDRDFAVGFYAHGIFKKLVDKALGGE